MPARSMQEIPRSMRALRLLTFSLCGQTYAIDLAWVREVLPMARLSGIPGSPPILEGFLNLRGIALPVLRLDRLFRLEGFVAGLESVILVLEGQATALGLMADAAEGILTVDEAALQPVGGRTSLNDCVRAEVEIEEGGRLLCLLSPERLLLDLEREKVAGLRELAQARLGEPAGGGGYHA